jgi:hypothetical protein
VSWGHSKRDAPVAHALGVRGRAHLRELRGVLTARDYPTGHGLAHAEIADLADGMEDSAQAHSP